MAFESPPSDEGPGAGYGKSGEAVSPAHLRLVERLSDFCPVFRCVKPPQRGDVVIDVGAGRGEDTLTFSRAVGRTGRVIAIEAHPLSFKILQRFCLLNELSNVTLLPFVLLDKPGTVRLVENRLLDG
jgi:tRNA G46 methylase TrmB